MKTRKTTQVNELVDKIVAQLGEIDDHFSKKGHLSYQDQYFVLRLQEISLSADIVVRELRARQAEESSNKTK